MEAAFPALHNRSMAKKVQPRFKPGPRRHFIKQWRKHRGLTQEQLAARAEVTPGTISQLEKGRINYTQPTLEAIADAMQISPGDLLNVSIPLAEGLRIDSPARVAWVQGRALGVAFQPALTDPCLAALSRWVFLKREEERDRIPARLEVVKGRTGSTLRGPASAAHGAAATG